MSATQPRLSDALAAISDCGFAIWATHESPAADFRKHFDDVRIPVVGIRHVRQWGIQVDDERELMGHERTSVADEELWQVVLQAKDGTTYEVNSRLVVAAPR
ncbi:MAG: hypothetical protein RKR03_01150 [Candidatus Competibacter sp.]|nr:hypothetical protein [Candidatus Competibacter sp.]